MRDSSNKKESSNDDKVNREFICFKFKIVGIY